MTRYQQTQAAVDRHYDGIQRAAEQIEHEDRLDACEVWARAQSIAHDPVRLDELQADGPLDYSKVFIKVYSQQRDLFAAADYLRLRIMAGRHAEADCIARDMTDALAAEIADMLISGRL